MPARELQTVVVQWRPTRASAEAMAARLRHSEVPVISRVRDDAICFDLRTLRESDVEGLVASASSAVWEGDAE